MSLLDFSGFVCMFGMNLANSGLFLCPPPHLFLRPLQFSCSSLLDPFTQPTLSCLTKTASPKSSAADSAPHRGSSILRSFEHRTTWKVKSPPIASIETLSGKHLTSCVQNWDRLDSYIPLSRSDNMETLMVYMSH